LIPKTQSFNNQFQDIQNPDAAHNWLCHLFMGIQIGVDIVNEFFQRLFQADRNSNCGRIKGIDYDVDGDGEHAA